MIKFTMLFGLLAVELAITMSRGLSTTRDRVLSLVFVCRSFYGMRIPVDGK